jgi:hypothetical protein
VGVRASTGGRFAPGGANGGRRGSGGGTRARRSGWGRVFIDAGGRLGGLGVHHAAGARAAWAARCGDVRRSGGPMASGGWHAGGWEAATWHRPSAHGRHAQWHSGTTRGPMGPPVPQRARAVRVRWAGVART